MTLTRKDLDSGGLAWEWVSYTGLDDTRVRHQIQWLDDRQQWLHWQRIDDGGWTERDVKELPTPDDEDHAERIVRALMGQIKRGA